MIWQQTPVIHAMVPVCFIDVSLKLLGHFILMLQMTGTYNGVARDDGRGQECHEVFGAVGVQGNAISLTHHNLWENTNFSLLFICLFPSSLENFN